MPELHVVGTAIRPGSAARTVGMDRVSPGSTVSQVSDRPDASQAVEDKPVWLFIDLASIYGGHEVMLLRWIDVLRQQGEVEPVLVCAEGSRLAALAPARVRTITVKLAEGSLPAKVFRFGQMLRQLWALRQRYRPVLAVVAEGCVMAQRHGLFAARALGLRTVLYVPIVSSFTDMGSPDAARLDRKVRGRYRRLPAAFLTITPPQADALRQWTGIEQPVFCLPNTVAAKFDRAAASTPAPGTPARVLVLGRLDAHHKGLDTLLTHLQAHPELRQKVNVSFVGEGPYLAVLQAAMRNDPTLGDWLSLEGWQDGAAAIASHDVLLISSRFEGVPLVMLEAMTAGVPVVSTDLPGTRPYLPEACLFQFGDLGRAFEAVCRLQANPAWRAGVVARNLQVYARLASPAAFDTAVRRLTAQLHHALGVTA
jgi:glycosyltransferase involved in cell wall biosynthesis